MSDIFYAQNINIFQLIYRKYFKRFSWGSDLKNFIMPAYLKFMSMGKFFSKLKYKPFKMVWCAENLGVTTSTTTANDIDPLYIVNDCSVTGCSRFIFYNGMISFNTAKTSVDLDTIYKKYYLQEELFGDAIFNTDSSVIRLNSDNPKIKLFGYWISTLNVSSSNWMHFISECTPMLNSTMKNAKNLPFGIILDADLPRQALEVIRILSSRTPRFGIARGFKVEVEHLMVPAKNTASCIAFWPRKEQFGNGVFDFDTDSLRDVRTKILQHFSITPQAKKKIYINRKSFFRFIVNSEEIEDALSSEDFELITPGNLSLQEQVEFFSQTSILVAQAGAALANIMFMPEGSTVICITIDSEWVNEEYFRQYAKIFNVNLVYVKGNIDNVKKYDSSKLLSVKHPMNADFILSKQALLETLSNVQTG